MTGNYSNDEFDFRLIFDENGSGPHADVDDVAGFPGPGGGVDAVGAAANAPITIPCHTSASGHAATFCSPPRANHGTGYTGPSGEPGEVTYSYLQGPSGSSGAPPAGGAGGAGGPGSRQQMPVFECPSIQITSISPRRHDMDVLEEGGDGGPAGGGGGVDGARALHEGRERGRSRDQLYLSLEHGFYRESALSLSPASSVSSRSCFSDASSLESYSYACDDVEAELNEATSRIGLHAASPLSASPLPSPGGSPHLGSLDDAWAHLPHQQHQLQLQQQQHQQQHYHQQHHQQQQPPSYGTHLQVSPRHSPSGSPRTSITEENYLSPRPSSPCGKRRHSGTDASAPSPSRTPSPLPSPRSLGLAEPAGPPFLTPVPPGNGCGGGGGGGGGGGSCSPTGASPDLGPMPGAAVLDISESVPPKARRTSLDQASAGGGVGDERDSPCDSFQQHCAKKDLPPVLASPALHMAGDNFLAVPPLFSWKSKVSGGGGGGGGGAGSCGGASHMPLFRSTSLPSLDWQLPSAAGPYELRVDVQPKSHHRAHYETEGSRGAVKATTGGHPVVKLVGFSQKPLNLQMFIGTADERLLRPHAFYQVHRITGKTVATPSQECVLTGTKVLEIPILPENGMTACIDCAGILKLRNSDIELRKGETDIGRKNTRVRLVFRVHIPQPGGKVLSLQATSIPVECSQRSAQELPLVEGQSVDGCTANGGQQLVLRGHNFQPESRVVFLEKGPDGRNLWEVEAKVDKDKSEPTNLVVEVPPYQNKSISHQVQVQFHVCNGKRKRSQPQRFTYLPTNGGLSPALRDLPMLPIKSEPSDDFMGTTPTTPGAPEPADLSVEVPPTGPLLLHLVPPECADMSAHPGEAQAYQALHPMPPNGVDMPMDQRFQGLDHLGQAVFQNAEMQHLHHHHHPHHHHHHHQQQQHHHHHHQQQEDHHHGTVHHQHNHPHQSHHDHHHQQQQQQQLQGSPQNNNHYGALAYQGFHSTGHAQLPFETFAFMEEGGDVEGHGLHMAYEQLGVHIGMQQHQQHQQHQHYASAPPPPRGAYSGCASGSIKQEPAEGTDRGRFPTQGNRQHFTLEEASALATQALDSYQAGASPII